jgi:DNA-directed RNA polymerase II subunit RPB7
MFFHIELSKSIQLPPRELGPHLQQTLRQKLSKDMEGQCTDQYGYIIEVTSIIYVGPGKINDTDGHATFPVRYKAIVFRPFKNEVMDAIVTAVNKMGFFALVGPMQVFVSKYSIPPDMTFDQESTTPRFVGEEDLKIQKDSEVRLKILNYKREGNDLFAIGTIREDYLGPTQ